VVPAANLLVLPDPVPFVTAAAASLTCLTAWRMLVQQAKVRPGETVLILGAGGGLGTAAIQVARLMGGTVFATTRNPAKAQRAVELGAAHVIDIRDKPDWASTMLDATGGRGVDVVVEHIGQATWTNSLNALARGGRMVVVGRTSGQIVQMDIRSVYRKQVSIVGTTMGSHQDYRDVMALVFSGAVRPIIDRVLPLGRGVEALTLLDRCEQFGKIVLEP
jgi:NADPH:quinone reductase-like Zn-dependent oxidoreductase